ncbi:MAG: hypothetical protein ABSH48_01050 [Verrucomicrobiota bacterium]|jgi:hypothetical protein
MKTVCGQHFESVKAVSNSLTLVLLWFCRTASSSLSDPLAPGSLHVTLSPTNAICAGAQWQVDGGAWQVSAATVTNLSAGNHMILFKKVRGWKAPPSLAIIISPDFETVTNANYATGPAPPSGLHVSF